MRTKHTKDTKQRNHYAFVFLVFFVPIVIAPEAP